MVSASVSRSSSSRCEYLSRVIWAGHVDSEMGDKEQTWTLLV